MEYDYHSLYPNVYSVKLKELETKVEAYEKSNTDMFSLLREQMEYIEFLHGTLERRMNL